jgi:N-acetylglucosaminyldiphosphoundecaprenol N-acetyl-beta-D-mannosaminyltransferase
MTFEFPRRPPALLFGVPIDDLTMPEAVATVAELVDDGRRQSRTHQIATVNVDFLVNALADETVRRLLQNCDMCLADGAPILWGARIGHMSLRERIAGADLLPALAEQASSRGWRIHLFGASTGTAERAAELLNARYTGAGITGDSGPMIHDVTRVDEELVTSLEAAAADILCVALGNPKQEKFIAAYRQRLGTPVMIGIGGTLDFIVGGRRRAPIWVQRAGLEWLVRAAQEPGRLGKRYAHDAVVYFPHLARYLRDLRHYGSGDSLRFTVSNERVIVTATILPQSDGAGWREATGAVAAGARATVDLSVARSLSVPALCEVAGLVRETHRSGAPIDVVDLSPAVTSQLDRIGLAAYLLEAETNGGRERG